jgi:hypothetical protein
MSCAEPVSWLRLERRALGELGVTENEAIDRHLAACADCAGAAEALQGKRALAPLPPVKVRRRWVWSLLLAPAAAAAALLLVPRSDRIKGSDVALTLIRERAGDVDLDPTVFAPGDRFKLLVTCPVPHALNWDVAIFQEGNVTFPFADRPALPCANRVPLPGALRLAGPAPVTICLLWGRVDRGRLQSQGAGGTGERARCERVLPRPTPSK